MKNKKSVCSKADFSYKNPENNTDYSMNNYSVKGTIFTVQYCTDRKLKAANTFRLQYMSNK